MAEKEFQKKSLFTKVPVLITPTSKASGVVPCLKYIATLVPERKLAGENGSELEVDQWLYFAIQDIKPVLVKPTFNVMQRTPCTQAEVKRAEEILARIDGHLKLRTFLVGNQLTIADICIYFTLAHTMILLFSQEQAKQLPHLLRWFMHINTLPGFEKCRKYNGPPPKPFALSLAEDLSFKSPKEEPKTQALAKPNEHQKAPLKPQQKQPQKPKEKQQEQKVQEAKTASDVDPLTLLPSSSMDLNEMKFAFVNEPNKETALKNFWEKFDKGGWSFWHLRYDKAEGEGEVLYRTSNLMNGFLQKNDHFRKWCFGVHGVYGEEPQLEIRGVWMWRGLEIPKQIRETDQFEYYKWRRLSHEADRRLIEEYWKGIQPGEVVDGFKVQDATYFK